MASVEKNIITYTDLSTSIKHYIAVRHVVKVSYDDLNQSVILKTSNNETITLKATTDVLKNAIVTAINLYG